ncbi:MAG: hypothetical protein Edafosvirus31_8 [Edafosvirus sp.]|uniref:Uncharacterized protein n=1 Tax=Edafosvirus sp. TaxID=2487765 RepID=A0A3G4ZV35_9VIRU|nr:MAG: hypothetical protein Edafosvirus31_8 [Edafosvirus sp.]
MSQDDLLELKKKDRDAYEQKVDSQFPYFVTKHFKIMNILYDDNMDNIDYLITMLSQLHNVKNNKDDFDNVSAGMIENITDELVYKKHGGKEAFEKAMASKAPTAKIKKIKN